MLEHIQSRIRENHPQCGKLGWSEKYRNDYQHTNCWRRTTKSVRYYITPLSSDAKRILHVIRRHWAIENELHWVLDVAMDEDHNRVHKEQAPENMAVLRHIALNLLKQEKTAKGGLHAKQLQAAWNNDYLCKILAVGI